MEIAANITAALLGLMYLSHGFAILAGQQMQRQSAETIGWPWERFRLVAIPEIAAGIGLLAGFWSRGLAAAAAFGVVLIMIGAAILRIRAGDDRRNVVADLVIAAIAAAIGVVQLLAL